MADVFDDIYAQAMILTGGNISLLTTTELVPLWADYQKTSNGKMVNDVRVILMDAAYNPQDANTNRKINSCLNTLEVGTRGPIKALVHNPRIVRSLLKVHEIPVWRDMFMTKDNIRKVTSSKWSNEVHIHHCFNYNRHY